MLKVLPYTILFTFRSELRYHITHTGCSSRNHLYLPRLSNQQVVIRRIEDPSPPDIACSFSGLFEHNIEGYHLAITVSKLHVGAYVLVNTSLTFVVCYLIINRLCAVYSIAVEQIEHIELQD